VENQNFIAIVKDGPRKTIYYSNGRMAYDGRVDQPYFNNGKKSNHYGFVSDTAFHMDLMNGNGNGEFFMQLGRNMSARVSKRDRMIQFHLFLNDVCVASK
jgi:hypothetical protein